MKVNLKHSRYHVNLGVVHLHENAYSRKKLLLICAAELFEESTVNREISIALLP